MMQKKCPLCNRNHPDIKMRYYIHINRKRKELKGKVLFAVWICHNCYTKMKTKSGMDGTENSGRYRRIIKGKQGAVKKAKKK